MQILALIEMKLYFDINKIFLLQFTVWNDKPKLYGILFDKKQNFIQFCLNSYQYWIKLLNYIQNKIENIFLLVLCKMFFIFCFWVAAPAKWTFLVVATFVAASRVALTVLWPPGCNFYDKYCCWGQPCSQAVLSRQAKVSRLVQIDSST